MTWDSSTGFLAYTTSRTGQVGRSKVSTTLTGGDWEAFMQMSTWVLEGLVESEHYVCWSFHIFYLLQILERSLTVQEIDAAEELAREFRQRFAALYEDGARFPNNHQVSSRLCSTDSLSLSICLTAFDTLALLSCGGCRLLSSSIRVSNAQPTVPTSRTCISSVQPR